MNNELLTIINEIRTTNYQQNTSYERQATCDEFALFWPLYVSFCAFCASLRLTRTVFTRLLKKAILMALWTKASLSVKSSLLEQSLPRTSSRPKTNQRQSAKSAFKIRVKPRLINDLRSTKDYVRKNKLFMQNKANFRKVKLNVNKVLTRDYVQMDTWSIGKTKPIQSQSKPIKANSKPIQSQSKPIRTQNKPKQSQYNANFRIEHRQTPVKYPVECKTGI